MSLPGGGVGRKPWLVCGILAPLLYAAADALAGLRWAGYSFRDHTISELGAIGAPSRPLFSGLLHLVEGAVAVAMVLAAIGFAASALGWRFRVYSAVTVVLVLAFGAWSGMDAHRVEAGLATPWLGVKERVFWYAYQLWFAVLAVTLLREAPGAGPPSCCTRTPAPSGQSLE